MAKVERFRIARASAEKLPKLTKGGSAAASFARTRRKQERNERGRGRVRRILLKYVKTVIKIEKSREKF